MINHEYKELSRNGKVYAITATWANVKLGDECSWIESIGAKVSAACVGEFGVNGTCQIEGSILQKDIGILHSGIGFEQARFKKNDFINILEASRYIRPAVIDGDENTNLTISILVVL